MQNLDQILGDKNFWRFEVRARNVGARVPERHHATVSTGNYGRQELHLAVNDFICEVDEGNEHVELYVVMTDGDPSAVDAGHWERLIAWPNPEDGLTGAWTTLTFDVHHAAMDLDEMSD